MQSKSIIAAIGLVVAAQSYAQEDAVVVTATRFPEKRLEHPVGVTVITRDQIANSTAATLPDLLSRYAGIYTRNNAGSPDVSIDMRGFGISGDQNSLVLLDGQRLNENELVTVRWSAIPLDAIERVEVQRGGGAVMYGGGATGGTINIITRSPIAGSKSADVGVARGTYNTNGQRASLNIAGANTGFALTANQTTTDNFRVNNRLEQQNLLGDLRWAGDRAGLVFKFGLDNQSLRLPGVRTMAQLDSDRRGTTTPQDYSSRDAQNAALSGRYQFDAADFAVDLSYRDTKRNSFFAAFGGAFNDTRTKVWGLTPRLKVPYQVLGRENTLVLGMDAYEWDYVSLRANRPESLVAPLVNLAARQKDRGYYAQNHTAITAATKLTLGMRAQSAGLTARDRINAASYANASQSRSPRAWEAALRHNLNSSVGLFGKLGTSYRVATVDEIYSQFNGPAGDSIITPLEPQTSRDKEAGVEYKHGGGSLRLTLYRVDLRNEIHFNAITFANMNLSPTRRDGAELEGGWKMGKGWDLFASYTRARATFREGVYGGVNVSGKNVPLVPREQAKLGLTWAIADKTRLSGALGYVGKQVYDNDQANTFPGQMPSYTTADIKFSHAKEAWKFTLAGNNLTDKKYYTYAIRNGAGTSFNAYPMLERNFLLTAEYRFK